MSPFPYPSSGQRGGQGLIQPIGWGAAQGRIQPIGWGGATQGRIQPVGWGNSKVDPADWLGGNSRTDPVGRFGGPLKGGSSQSVWGVNSRAYPAGRFAGQLKGGSSRSVWGSNPLGRYPMPNVHLRAWVQIPPAPTYFNVRIVAEHVESTNFGIKPMT